MFGGCQLGPDIPLRKLQRNSKTRKRKCFRKKSRGHERKKFHKTKVCSAIITVEERLSGKKSKTRPVILVIRRPLVTLVRAILLEGTKKGSSQKIGMHYPGHQLKEQRILYHKPTSPMTLAMLSLVLLESTFLEIKCGLLTYSLL